MAACRIDERGVSRDLGDGKSESVEWAELTAVWIVTTADGPFGEDFFWVLQAGSQGCVVGQELAGDLLSRLQRLPRFDNEAAIKASMCTEEARFDCWKGEPGEGLAAAKLEARN
ncbi:MAG TPA: hypothetical protein VGK67_13430 [Myxococcales bacterium]|jgi:hypothetical protein